MQCPHCGVENRRVHHFCAACGGAMPAICAACGFVNEAAARFCGGCGQSLGPRPDTTYPEQAPPVYTPKYLAERIHTARRAIEGEHKQVTVLFCDLVESSRLAAQLEPAEMHQVMDRIRRLMAETVHRYDGTVHQFLGDGVMALFGAPVALEDHALRAVQAALAIQETVTGLGTRLQRDRGVEVSLRSGINTGPVVVGRIGDDLRMDYTPVGDTTHLAARLQALAGPGAILVSDSTHRAVAGFVQSAPLGPAEVKGRAEPVPVYQVMGLRRRSRLEARIERGRTPLVGRTRELELLRECWLRAKTGRGQIVGVLGEPGVGKSRLLLELRDSLGADRLTWLEGQCAAQDQATPYVPLLEVLRLNFRIDQGDHPLQVEEKLRRGLERLGMSPDDVLPFLRELFQLPGDDHPTQHLDPQTKRRRTFEAIWALTLQGARRQPLIVAIEDLHWADRTTEDFLAFVAPRVSSAPLMLIITQRPGDVARWPDQSWSTRITLDVLAERDVEAMLVALLGSPRIPPSLLQSVVEKAEGNPLSVEEIASSLRERGLVVRTTDGVRWSRDIAVDFPGTVQDVVRARIDRLAEPVKETIQSASAIGRRFSPRLLAAISTASNQVESDLATLKQVELVYESRVLPEPELAFRHAVIQDVAYQGMLAKRRSDLHGAIGAAVERLYADQLDDQAAVLVHHYRRAGQDDKVVRYGLLAGDRAARLYATAEAKSHYEEALAALRGLPATPDTQRTEIDLVLKLAAVAVTRQDIERDRANLTRARATAETLGDEARVARVLYWLGRLEYVLWNPAAAIDHATRSLEIGERLGDDAILAPPVNLLGRIYWIQSDFARSARMLERNVEQMRRLGNKGEESTAAATAGCVFGLMGEFERAVSFAGDGIRLAEEIHNPFAEAAAYQQRGIIFDQRGDWPRALADYAIARRVAERIGDLFRVFVVKSWEGRARIMMGEAAAGRALVEEGLQIAGQIGTRMILGWQKAFLAAGDLALGNVPAAASVSEEAILAAHEVGDRASLALAKRTLAEALWTRDETGAAQAQAVMLEAIHMLEEAGARPELARTHASYAGLLARAGHDRLAALHRATSLRLFAAMGMSWDLERAGGLAPPPEPGRTAS